METMNRPIVRLADTVRRLRGWRRWLLAIAMGGLASVSLPPAHALPLLWIALPVFVWILDSVETRKGAFWLGWCFGFGYLATSLYWLTFALFVAIDQYWWLVPFASNGLAAGLAIYWGLMTCVAAALVPRSRPLARCLMLVALWSLSEWLRGHLLTGFPWNLPGYAWTGYPWLIQSAAWIGIYGVTVLVLLAPTLASLLGSEMSPKRGLAAFAAGLGILAIVAIAGALRYPAEPMPTVPGVRLRLVQPSIQQSLKWVEGRYQQNLWQHIDLSVRPAEPAPNIIVWSEAAEPFPLSNPENARFIASKTLKPGQLLITGTVREFPKADPPSYSDSIAVLNPAGDVIATFDKYHYVPFGEYMPLARWLPIVKAVAAGDVEPTEGPGPVTLDLPGLPPAGPTICYEVIFPHAIVDEDHRPDWLLDVTNDAWFGLTAGPYQHFAMMRVRAVEEGLPLVNAANDGISGVIDPYGRIVTKLALGAIGVIDADLPKKLDKTFYARVGDSIFFAMVAGLTLAGLLIDRRKL